MVKLALTRNCIRRLKKGKAGGPDNLCAEHLMYAHPTVVIHLQLLFRLILSHGFVPDKFGHGISIPLIKDINEKKLQFIYCVAMDQKLQK